MTRAATRPVGSSIVVPYHPPLTTSMARAAPADGPRNPIPLSEGPALARARQPRGGGRWHRVRYGRYYPAGGWRATGYTGIGMWCGTLGIVHEGPRDGGGGFIFATALPDDGLPLCGGCEGKAIGAGYGALLAAIADPRGLIFQPRNLDTPDVCPSARNGYLIEWQPPPHANVGWCHACGTEVRSWGSKVRRHAPGPGLVRPCWEHGWDSLIVGQHRGEDETRVVCRCRLIEHFDPETSTYYYEIDEGAPR